MAMVDVDDGRMSWTTSYPVSGESNVFAGPAEYLLYDLKCPGARSTASRMQRQLIVYL